MQMFKGQGPKDPIKLKLFFSIAFFGFVIDIYNVAFGNDFPFMNRRNEEKDFQILNWHPHHSHGR